MQQIFLGEQRGGRIKLTSDRDCLSPDIIHFEDRVIVDDAHLLAVAYVYEARGFTVCIDTETLSYETPEVRRGW